jgi:hypothetical protein
MNFLFTIIPMGRLGNLKPDNICAMNSSGHSVAPTIFISGGTTREDPKAGSITLSIKRRLAMRFRSIGELILVR